MSIIKNHVQISESSYIRDYYDTNCEITADSDPVAEYAIWHLYCKNGNDDLKLLSLKDFENYINGLK